jgi:large subunit ribosomal protein L6
MSRIAKKALTVPTGVEVSINGQTMKVKGAKGAFDLQIHDAVAVTREDNVLKFAAKSETNSNAWALAGTTRALANNMVTGVSQGFEKKLQLVGVGYRAQAQGAKLNLSLGYSHPIVYDMPEGITVETPSQTEIIIRGSDKQKVGQVAADVRAYRPPEPYKGKGVKYADETILRKETKKKK